jgi:hypothetical protein
MPLFDHFHPPLHGPRRWEGFHHSWAASIARQLNQDVLPADYFAESEISVGPEMEIDVATMQQLSPATVVAAPEHTAAVWAPSEPLFSIEADFSRLDTYEIRVYQDLGGAELRGAIELVSPGNKDRAGSRLTFAAKCAGYLQHGIGVVIVDVVTSRSANLHAQIVDMLNIKTRRDVWRSATDLYAVSYRPVTVRRTPRVEVWPEPLELAKELPTLPLWLRLDLSVPLPLEESYQDACRSLRIPA